MDKTILTCDSFAKDIFNILNNDIKDNLKQLNKGHNEEDKTEHKAYIKGLKTALSYIGQLEKIHNETNYKKEIKEKLGIGNEVKIQKLDWYDSDAHMVLDLMLVSEGVSEELVIRWAISRLKMRGLNQEEISKTLNEMV